MEEPGYATTAIFQLLTIYGLSTFVAHRSLCEGCALAKFAFLQYIRIYKPSPDFVRKHSSRRNYRYVFVPTVIKWVCSTNGLRRISQHLILQHHSVWAYVSNYPPTPGGLSTGFYPEVQYSPSLNLAALIGIGIFTRVKEFWDTCDYLWGFKRPPAGFHCVGAVIWNF